MIRTFLLDTVPTDTAGCFAHAFLWAQSAEYVAANVPWDERSSWYERAVAAYENAANLAKGGEFRGLDLVSDSSFDGTGLTVTPSERAVVLASYRAGILRVAEFRVRDLDRAVAHLRAVTSLVSGYHPSWYYLGEAYNLAGHFDDAQDVWREGLARRPDDSALLAVLEKLPIDRVHDRRRAEDWPGVLRELARLPPNLLPDSERYTIEGDARLGLGDFAGARFSWEAALAADSLVVGVHQRLRRLPERSGATKSAD
jgi:tetratricopeptide (TPR) repeat protein